jgi:hypothetical protein
MSKFWLWLRGYAVCYSEHESGTAFCKRRKHHLGKHATGNKHLRWDNGGAAGSDPGPASRGET